MIHIAFALDDYFHTYSAYAGVAIASIFENTTSKITIHLLHDNTMTAENKSKFQQLCTKYGQHIRFYNILMDAGFNQREIYDSLYPNGIFYRIYLPELLDISIEKIIYLDTDTLIQLDIAELWNTPMQGKSLAGVKDRLLRGVDKDLIRFEKPFQPFVDSFPWEQYINSGVLVMDLPKIRRKYDMVQQTIDFFKVYPMRYPDQDALNSIFIGDICFLDKKFNTFTQNVNCAEKGKIYHGSMSNITKVYIEFYKKTPWFVHSMTPIEQRTFIESMHSRLGVLEQILALKMPFTSRYEASYALSLMHSGKTQEAADYSKAVLRAEDSYDDYQKKFSVRITSLIRLSEFDKAIEELLLSLKTDAPNFNITDSLGFCFMQKENYDIAAAWFEMTNSILDDMIADMSLEKRSSEKMNEARFHLYQQLTKCHSKMGRTKKARYYNDKAALIQPNSVSVRLNAIALNGEKGRSHDKTF